MEPHPLDSENLQKLLEALDSGPEHAGEKYVSLHKKLKGFFQKRGHAKSEELADETLNRVAKKLNDGVFIVRIEAYAMGVAGKIHLEECKRKSKEPEVGSLDSDKRDIENWRKRQNDLLTEDSLKRRLECLGVCEETLRRDVRRLFTRKNWEMFVGSYNPDKKLRPVFRTTSKTNRWYHTKSRMKDVLLSCMEKCTVSAI